MIRLLLVDDQDIFRQGLATLLSTEADLEIVAQANNGESAIALAEKLQPDIILMDVKMPICDGVTATGNIHRRYPWIQILMLTTFDDDEYICKSLQAGAKGYLLKRESPEKMAIAIRAVSQGYAQLSPEIAPKVFSQVKYSSSENNKYLDALSSRELEVLQLVSKGKSNHEIASVLNLSTGTVKNYITQILSKLEIRDRIAAALWAKDVL